MSCDFTFPIKEDGRRFHHHYFQRTLVIGEKIKRTWLCCFCCKLFLTEEHKLVTEGLAEWGKLGWTIEKQSRADVPHGHLERLRAPFATGLEGHC